MHTSSRKGLVCHYHKAWLKKFHRRCFVLLVQKLAPVQYPRNGGYSPGDLAVKTTKKQLVEGKGHAIHLRRKAFCRN